MADAILEWISVLQAMGGGLLTIEFDARGDSVLCHVTTALVVAEACPPPRGFSNRELARLVALGWLPPGEDSPRWSRRWLVDDAGEVVADLRALAVAIYRLVPLSVRLVPGPCRHAACVVHASPCGDG
jgi:hypothetical protein